MKEGLLLFNSALQDQKNQYRPLAAPSQMLLAVVPQ
jgi:hypothetical protein